MVEIISRYEAINRGLKRYFTGEPCRRGHICERRVRCYSCLECHNAWQNANRDHERRREYYRNNKSRENENSRKYHAKNKDRRRQYAREYAVQNPELRYLNGKRWREKNPNYRQQYRQKNRAKYLIYIENRRTRQLGTRLSKDLAVKLLKSQRGKCDCCGGKLGNDYQLDHIIPLSRGGPHIDSNIQLTHRICNFRKGSKLPHEMGMLL